MRPHELRLPHPCRAGTKANGRTACFSLGGSWVPSCPRSKREKLMQVRLWQNWKWSGARTSAPLAWPSQRTERHLIVGGEDNRASELSFMTRNLGSGSVRLWMPRYSAGVELRLVMAGRPLDQMPDIQLPRGSAWLLPCPPQWALILRDEPILRRPMLRGLSTDARRSHGTEEAERQDPWLSIALHGDFFFFPPTLERLPHPSNLSPESRGEGCLILMG